MEYCRLGNTGMKVSRICLGMMSYGTPKWREWVLDEEESIPFVKRAIDLGINFFDTADVYSQGESERVLGKAIKPYNREELIIATKVFGAMGTTDAAGNNTGLSRKHIMHAIEQSLKRLDMNYVDLYQIHRFDKTTPVEETMEALHDLVRAGKVRYIGASSMYTYQFAKMQAAAEKRGLTKFISMQNHYNLVYREEEREMNPYCVHEGVGLIPWSPLARGFLSGNRKPEDVQKIQEVSKTTPTNVATMVSDHRAKTGQESKVDLSTATKRTYTDTYSLMYYQAEDFKIVDRVVELANKKGKKPAQIALSWMLSKPGVCSPIIGATKMSHLEEAVSSVSIKLTPEEISYLEELYKPHVISGHT